jgi:SAM-dependent methyltransferase
MPTVSILIPARHAEFVGRAILSAQRQTFEDVEILIGDDTPDGALEAISKRPDDPRVRYFRHGFEDGLRNARALWAQAKGQYVKWLDGDDVLMPGSVAALVGALRANPQAVLAFHERVLTDESDAIVQTPPALQPMGHVSLVDRQFIVDNLVANAHNVIGELSNTMLVRERVDIERLFDYRSQPLAALADMAMFLNCAQEAPIVAVGGYESARRQSGQAAEAADATFSAALYEWEAIVRGEAAAGHLAGATLALAKSTLKRLYAQHSTALPEISRLLANLDELSQANTQGIDASPRYRADLAHARAAVAARVQRRRNGPASLQQKFCVICEQPVAGWLPHPHVGRMDRTFALQIESVGSTLQNHLCPSCGCNDRERHLWLYLAYSRVLEEASSKRILHIAPERGVEPRIRRLQPREYIVGDLFPSQAHHRKIDVENLDFADGAFDLIICNHVLEHVEHPRKALAEFHRCLAPNGHLIAQTPYSPVLRHTFEMTKAATEPFAVYYYGQNDHVRLFGSDIADYFREAGFAGDLYPHTSVLGAIEPDTYGCNGREPFFFFAKGDAPAFVE